MFSTPEPEFDGRHKCNTQIIDKGWFQAHLSPQDNDIIIRLPEDCSVEIDPNPKTR